MSALAPTLVAAPLLLPVPSRPRERAFEALRVEGELPPGLIGTLYRNGPADFSGPSDHWFDGVGAITAIRFAGGNARGAVRFVGEAGDPTRGRYRHRASVAGRLKTLLGSTTAFANLANINVLHWQDRVFALYEGAPATEFDKDTLARLGPTDFGGIAPQVQAHPHRVPALRTTFHIGMRLGRRSYVILYALPDEGPAREVARVEVPGLSEVHDFFVTERAAVLLLSPLWGTALDLVRTGSFERSLQWDPSRGTEVVVIPLADPTTIRRFSTDPFFWYHGVNAWDEEDGTVGIEWVRYPSFEVSDGLDRLHRGEPVDLRASLWRAKIDASRERFDAQAIRTDPVEFPFVADAVVGRRHRYAWMAAWDPQGGWPDRLVQWDTARDRFLEAPAGGAVGEPVIASHGPDELDAWILAMVRTADSAHLAIWDARRFPAEPVARVWFDGPLPHSLHGMWVPGR